MMYGAAMALLAIESGATGKTVIYTAGIRSRLYQGTDKYCKKYGDSVIWGRTQDIVKLIRYILHTHTHTHTHHGVSVASGAPRDGGCVQAV